MKAIPTLERAIKKIHKLSRNGAGLATVDVIQDIRCAINTIQRAKENTVRKAQIGFVVEVIPLLEKIIEKIKKLYTNGLAFVIVGVVQDIRIIINKGLAIIEKAKGNRQYT